jgi:hypothetical protein
MRRTTWTTYRTTGYTYDAANDQASAGGVHHHQIRRTRNGWQKRIMQSNGRHIATSQPMDIPHDQGEEYYQIARNDKT